MFKIKLISSFTLLLTLSFSKVFAQETLKQSHPSVINGGVINGKAKSLQAPVYPEAAKAAGASGSVSVQVLIDENGDIVSAEAISGHPLLRAAAVEAARASKFTPTQLSGQPVKVKGVIVYNFVAAINTSNWFNIGLLMATLDKSPTLRYFDPIFIAQNVPAEWVAEQQQLQRLDELKKAELEANDDVKPIERVIEDKTTKSPDGSTLSSKTTAVKVSPDKKVSPEHIAIGQSLIASMQGRLSIDPFNLWYFNLGINVNQALYKADSRSEKERNSLVEPFRRFIKDAPVDVPKEILDELQKMSLLIEKGVFTDTDKIQLTESFTKLNTVIRNQ